MVYSRVNYMLGRVTGRNYIDKSNLSLIFILHVFKKNDLIVNS
jgi:hypothetical protein